MSTILLFGCATPGDMRSPSYSAGFGDGCATGSAEGGPLPGRTQRDQKLYDKDPDYRSGWISGRATCRMQSGPPRL